MDENPYAASYDADQQVLRVVGSVDELAGPVFREDLAKHTEQHTKPLSVDLSEVEFFPSLAVGVLAVAMRQSREAGAEIEVRAREGGIVARVLTICALPYTELPATDPV
ncbi:MULTISPECIES: STAS domain-containing protein [unclassified Nocardioides]|uniref:STAS domain-containing protein n=1 Tax=unclassified Nocardioides TaxID=2615069 RepID=UPI0036233A01